MGTSPLGDSSLHRRTDATTAMCHIVQAPNPLCRTRFVGIFLLVLFCVLAIQPRALAYPGPGVWSDVAPPDPLGGQVQLSAHAGSLYMYSTSVHLGSLGVSLDARLAQWAFLSATVEYAMIPVAGFGPTFVAGRKTPAGVRIVIAPRFGLDPRDTAGLVPNPVFGGHVLFDAPISPGGEIRWWVGLMFAHSLDRDEPFYSDTLFILGGFRFHVHRRIDLAMQLAGNPYFQTNYSSDCCWAKLSVFNVAFQFTWHIGKVDDQRAVLPAPDSLEGG